MKIHVQSGPYGITPQYVNAALTEHAPSIAALLRKNPANWQGWDHAGIWEYLQRAPSGLRTCLTGISPIAPECVLWSDNGQRFIKCVEQRIDIDTRYQPSLQSALCKAAERIIFDAEESGRRFALALSGGVDSALTYALLKCAAEYDFPVYTCTTGLQGYCERDRTLHHAELLRIPNLKIVEVRTSDLVAALPQAIAAAEVPLFNLHPVSRLLLAQEMRRDGIETMVTGDGADQTFSGSDARNYLPIVGALVRSTGMTLRSPFLEPDVIAYACQEGLDSNKKQLRAVARKIIGMELAYCPKTPRFAPDIDVSVHSRDDAIDRMARALNCSHHSSPASRMLWTTLGLLIQHIEESVLCAV